MSERRPAYIAAMLACITLLGVVAIWLLPRPRLDYGITIKTAAHEDTPSKFIVPQAQAVLDKVFVPGSQSNVLELLRASLDFAGYWVITEVAAPKVFARASRAPAFISLIPAIPRRRAIR